MEYDLLLSLSQTVHENFFLLFEVYMCFHSESLVNLATSQNLNPIASFSEYKHDQSQKNKQSNNKTLFN